MAHRSRTSWIPNATLAGVATFAVLALLFYAGASQSLGSSAAAATTTTSGTTSSAATTTTTSVTDCTPVAPTTGGVSPRATSVFLSVTSPSGYQCGALRTTTVALYADAAHTALVTSFVLTAGTTTSAVLLSGLTPSTDYYPVLSVDAPGTPTTSLPVTRTLAGSTATGTSTTTTTSTTSSYPCDYGGPATITPVASTTTTITYTYSFGGAYVSCSGFKSVYVVLYTDAAHTQYAGSWSTPSGAYSGAREVPGLTPGVTYYGQWQTQGPLGTSGAVQGFATQAAATTTTTTTGGIVTCQPIGIGGPSGTTSTSITWSLPTALCATVLTATAYRSQADAIAQTNPVATVTVSLPAPSITVSGLQSATDYWVRFSGGFGIQGPVRTGSAITTTTTRPTVICDPALPAAQLTGATTTSLTYLFASPGAIGCNGVGTTTIFVYADPGYTVLAGSASGAAGATSGTLTVTSLTPGTTYYPRLRMSNLGSASAPLPPASTLPLGTTTTTTTSATTTTTGPKSCTATWRTISSWPGGFLGEVTVQNTSALASSSWKVGWTWSGSARLTASYHATLGGTPASPTLTALDWNRVIQGGRSTAVQVQGTVSGSVVPPAITCTLS